MTLIKLTGELDPDLINKGFQPGDLIEAERDETSRNGEMEFQIRYNGMLNWCSVSPQNYELIKEL